MEVSKKTTESGTTPTDSSTYTLHIFPFSLYSIIARFTLALGVRSGARPGATAPHIEKRLVNLHRNENLDEAYMLTVNPRGQVPSLTGASLATPLADSRDISYWLCTHYPGLLPAAHESAIREMLARQHAINALALSVPVDDRVDVRPTPAIDALLARDDISPEYRRALETKRDNFVKSSATALSADSVRLAEDQARTYLADLLALRHRHAQGGLWLLGETAGPTLLDAHAAPLLVRMLDNNRDDLVPAELQEYARNIKQLPEWDQVLHGRATLWNVGYGHVATLDPF